MEVCYFKSACFVGVDVSSFSDWGVCQSFERFVTIIYSTYRHIASVAIQRVSWQIAVNLWKNILQSARDTQSINSTGYDARQSNVKKKNVKIGHVLFFRTYSTFS